MMLVMKSRRRILREVERAEDCCVHDEDERQKLYALGVLNAISWMTGVMTDRAPMDMVSKSVEQPTRIQPAYRPLDLDHGAAGDGLLK